MGVFSILEHPSNVRQHLMPFQLKPGKDINQYFTTNKSIGGANPQFFTFKALRKNYAADSCQYATGLLNICPSSYKEFFKDDIGYQLLYEYTKEKGITQEAVNINSIFENLPSLQIREFAIGSELDQLINFFSDLKDVFFRDNLKTDVMGTIKDIANSNSQSKSSKSKNSKSRWKKGNTENEKEGTGSFSLINIANKIGEIWKSIVDKIDNEVFIKSLVESLPERFTENYKNDKLYNKLLRFPFAIYYKLISCVTTNMYEVPISPDVIIQSKSEGFQGDNYGLDLGVPSFLSKSKIISNIIKTVTSSISINTSPLWDPTKLSTTGQTVTCKFKLFNDDIDSTINNFIFVNTIAANNMWYNYSIFKKAPALYDIKINGLYRYYMCTADITVKPAGPVRKVSNYIVKKLCDQYSSFLKNSQNVIDNEFISIPDIYDVELVFTSQLPNTFNNFLFTYAGNPDILKSGIGYQQNIITEFLKKLKENKSK